MFGGRGLDVCPGAGLAEVVRSCRRPQHDLKQPVLPQLYPCSLGSTQCGVLEPTDPPNLSAVSITPRSADITKGAIELEVQVGAYDDDSLVSVKASIRGPDGFSRLVTLTSADPFEYEFVGSTTLSQSVPTGTYWVDRVTLADSDGNTTEVDDDGLDAGDYGFARELEVYEGPDDTGPELRAQL